MHEFAQSFHSVPCRRMGWLATAQSGWSCRHQPRSGQCDLFPLSFLQVHGQKAAWEDPVEWVRDTLPWPSAQQDQSKLYHLPPPSVGPHSIVSPPEERSGKDTTPNSLESDPLVCPSGSGGRAKFSAHLKKSSVHWSDCWGNKMDSVCGSGLDAWSSSSLQHHTLPSIPL